MSKTPTDSLQDAKAFIQDCLKQQMKIVAFSGAGLSAESGISTFRDKNPDALWSKYDPTQLASPEGFQANPEMVTDWYNWRRKKIAEAECNDAHRELAKHPDILQVTQNVDNLLEKAGVSPEKVVHLHGEINKDRCNQWSCGYEEEVDLQQPPRLRKCPQCNQDYLRPGVVWFGESLPEDAWNFATSEISQCHCLLVIGTSATVYPAANLIPVAKHQGAKVIVINTETSGASHLSDWELLGQAGDILPRLFC